MANRAGTSKRTVFCRWSQYAGSKQRHCLHWAVLPSRQIGQLLLELGDLRVEVDLVLLVLRRQKVNSPVRRVRKAERGRNSILKRSPVRCPRAGPCWPRWRADAWQVSNQFCTRASTGRDFRFSPTPSRSHPTRSRCSELGIRWEVGV